MATKEFVALDGLTRYDQLLKGVMSTEDAKSIKVVTVSNNIVNFYKTETATGTPAYTVTLPTVSDFIHKISSATGGKVVTSTSGGEVAESELSVSNIVTYNAAGVTGYIANIDPVTKEVSVVNVGDSRLVDIDRGLEGFDEDHTVADAIDAIADDVADKMDKISSATGGKLVTSTSAGQVAESSTAISDLATKTFVGSIPAGSSSTSIVDYISEAISDASDDYIPKGTNWHDDHIAVTQQDGTLVESGYSLARYVIRDELGGYIHKGTNWGGNNVIVSNQNGDISETEYPIGCDNQVGIPVGYFDMNNAIVVTNIESGSTDLINSGISITDVESSIAATSGFDGDNTIADAFDELGTAASKDVGVANGVAELDSTGRVPSSQLPSYVDDVVDGYYYNNKFYEDSAHTKEITGQTGKIYIDLVSNKTYRWTGSGYAEISASLALGETSSTAYRGDRGKTAYDHSQLTSGNPHNVTKTDVGLGNVGNFKAVSTVASQGLTSTEQSNARANIGLGTAAVKDVPASGNASTTQVVMGNDTRVTDEPNLRAAFDALGFSVVNGALCQTYTA